MNNIPDIILAPVSTSQFLLYNSRFDFFGIDYVISNSIGFLDISSILSKMKVQTRPLFQSFRCFDHNIWSFILISIILISLLSSFKNFNITIFVKNVWKYSINLLGKSTTKINKTQGYLLINLKATWLLSAFMINILFNAFFLEEMVSPTPVTKIDSIDDLFKSDMVILARLDSALYTYLDSIQSPLINRIESYRNFESINEKLLHGLRSGSLAFVNQKFILIYSILVINDMVKQQRGNGYNLYKVNEISSMLHISKDDGGTEPYYLIINGNMDDDIGDNISLM